MGFEFLALLSSGPTSVLAKKNADMIKAEFREDVLDASATLDRLTSASLVRVDDLDAVAGPAKRDGHVGQPQFAHGRLLVLSHLLGTRLADIDDRFSIEMMVADLGGRNASKWAGTMTGHAGEVGVGEGGVNSVVLTAGLLPHRGWEAFGDDLAEHQQDFLTPRRGQARPSLDQ